MNAYYGYYVIRGCSVAVQVGAVLYQSLLGLDCIPQTGVLGGASKGERGEEQFQGGGCTKSPARDHPQVMVIN